jgi:hypothetical protein
MVAQLLRGALLLACLTGCASGQLGPDSPLPEGRGLVVLQVIADRQHVSTWSFAEVWALDGKVLYYVKPLETKAPDNVQATFVGQLPPGRYRVDALISQQRSGTLTIQYTLPVNDRFGTFLVDAGRLSCLGTITVGISAPPSLAYVPSDIEYCRQFVKQQLPKIDPQLQGKSPLTWDAGG